MCLENFELYKGTCGVASRRQASVNFSSWDVVLNEVKEEFFIAGHRLTIGSGPSQLKVFYKAVQLELLIKAAKRSSLSSRLMSATRSLRAIIRVFSCLTMSRSLIPSVTTTSSALCV